MQLSESSKNPLGPRLVRLILAGVSGLFSLVFAPQIWAQQALPVLPDTQHVRYFSNIAFRETPFSNISGVYPIGPIEAASQNHYRFEYDGQGRIIRASFMLAETPRSLNHTANYYFEAPRIDISYSDGFEERHYFDAHGNRIAVRGDVFVARFKLDALGYRERLEFFDVHGEATENSWGIATYQWTIEDDGTVVEVRYGLSGELRPLRSGFPFYEIEFHFGADGYLSVMRNLGTTGTLTLNELNAAQDRLIYDARGSLLSWNVLDTEGRLSVGNGPAVARGIIGYDANGYQAAQRHENESGQPMVSAYGWGNSRAEFDSFGNMIFRGNFEFDNETPVNNPQVGYSSFRYQFDASGRQQQLLSLFDENGVPALHARTGYSVRQQRHDEVGNVVEVSYLDTRGLLVRRADSGAARITHEYDARHRRVATHLFDENGEAVEHRSQGWASEQLTYVANTAVVDIRTRLTVAGQALSQ
jgi:YD repeat-containing protein